MLWTDFPLFQVSNLLSIIDRPSLNPFRISSSSPCICFYKSTIQLAWNGFKSDKFDDTLMSVESLPLFNCQATWSENQSLYRFWIKAFAVLLTVKSDVKPIVGLWISKGRKNHPWLTKRLNWKAIARLWIPWGRQNHFW